MALGATGKPVAPALKKEANKATNKSLGHATAGASTTAVTPSALPDVSSIDTSTKVGLIIFGTVVSLVVVYFVWNAVQNAHRAAAYTEVSKGLS